MFTVDPSGLGPEAVREDFWLVAADMIQLGMVIEANVVAGSIVSFFGFHRNTTSILFVVVGFLVRKQELTI